jgi:hypothetical protein
MDPFSVVGLAGSVGGLAAVAEATMRTLYKFIRGMKECKGEVKELILLVSGLSSVLRCLEVSVERFNDLDDPGLLLLPSCIASSPSNCWQASCTQNSSPLAPQH